MPNKLKTSYALALALALAFNSSPTQATTPAVSTRLCSREVLRFGSEWVKDQAAKALDEHPLRHISGRDRQRLIEIATFLFSQHEDAFEKEIWFWVLWVLEADLPKIIGDKRWVGNQSTRKKDEYSWFKNLILLGHLQRRIGNPQAALDVLRRLEAEYPKFAYPRKKAADKGQERAGNIYADQIVRLAHWLEDDETLLRWGKVWMDHALGAVGEPKLPESEIRAAIDCYSRVRNTSMRGLAQSQLLLLAKELLKMQPLPLDAFDLALQALTVTGGIQTMAHGHPLYGPPSKEAADLIRVWVFEREKRAEERNVHFLYPAIFQALSALNDSTLLSTFGALAETRAASMEDFHEAQVLLTHAIDFYLRAGDIDRAKAAVSELLATHPPLAAWGVDLLAALIDTGHTQGLKDLLQSPEAQSLTSDTLPIIEQFSLKSEQELLAVGREFAQNRPHTSFRERASYLGIISLAVDSESDTSPFVFFLDRMQESRLLPLGRPSKLTDEKASALIKTPFPTQGLYDLWDYYVEKKSSAGLRLLSDKQFATAKHDSQALRKILNYRTRFATNAFYLLVNAVALESEDAFWLRDATDGEK